MRDAAGAKKRHNNQTPPLFPPFQRLPTTHNQQHPFPFLEDNSLTINKINVILNQAFSGISGDSNEGVIMRIKYLAAGLCILILLLSVVSACGGGSSQPTPSSPTDVIGDIEEDQVKLPTGDGDSITDLFGLGMDVNNVKYDLTMTMTGQQSITMTIYKKDNKMRQEMTTAGISIVSIIDGDAQKMYTLMESQKMATEMPYTFGAMDAFTWQNYDDILKNSLDKIGTETIDGKSCTIVGWTYGDSSVKYWIWKEKGIPLKIETISGSTSVIMEYSNIDLSNISDDMFKVPDDYKMLSL
jgi:outer membrane lipoprotein-sorting protein